MLQIVDSKSNYLIGFIRYKTDFFFCLFNFNLSDYVLFSNWFSFQDCSKGVLHNDLLTLYPNSFGYYPGLPPWAEKGPCFLPLPSSKATSSVSSTQGPGPGYPAMGLTEKLIPAGSCRQHTTSNYGHFQLPWKRVVYQEPTGRPFG